jgi:hypothetical protein
VRLCEQDHGSSGSKKGEVGKLLFSPANHCTIHLVLYISAATTDTRDLTSLTQQQQQQQQQHQQQNH